MAVRRLWASHQLEVLVSLLGVQETLLVQFLEGLTPSRMLLSEPSGPDSSPTPKPSFSGIGDKYPPRRGGIIDTVNLAGSRVAKERHSEHVCEEVSRLG